MTDTVPHSLSWVDQLTGWIDRLRIPNWAFYVLAYLATVAMTHTASWIDGVDQWGEINPIWLLGPVWTVIPLVFIHYLATESGKAMDRFSVLIADQPGAAAALRRRMTTMPRLPVLWMFVIAAVAIPIWLLADRAVVYEGVQHPVSIVFVLAAAVPAYVFGAIGAYFGFHLLLSIPAAYRLVDPIDPYHQLPLHALSGVALRFGLFALLLLNLSLVDMAIGVERSETVVAVGFLVGVLVVAFALFLAPLWGVHRRLKDAKRDMLERNRLAIAESQEGHHQRSRGDDSGRVDAVGNSLIGFDETRNDPREIRIWPWPKGAFVFFLAAVIIPIALWAFLFWGAGVF